ncbi:MAG: polysaccharide deacetylase family protein [Deltaproteobacteria bacterium]|nr:polysaccharide deacetylase family protein [Deltaproteobacteria bacterium]
MLIGKLERMIARLAWSTGLTSLVIAWNRSRGKTPILMYHSVRPRPVDWKTAPMVWQTGMAVSPETFEGQIAEFTKRYRCVSVREYIDALSKGSAKGLLAITFDDGYIDNLETAAPILRRYGANATFFLIGCHLEGERPAPVALYNMAHDESSMGRGGSPKVAFSRKALVLAGEEALGLSSAAYGFEMLDWRPHYISPEEAVGLDAAGFEIGAHGYYHLIASALDVERFKSDLLRSKKSVDKLIRGLKPGFAFPYGTPPVITGEKTRAVRECGFSYAVTSIEGLNGADADRFALRRISADEVPLYVTMFRLTGLRAGSKRFFQRLKWKYEKPGALHAG